MAEAFRSEFYQTVDKKARMTIPAEFRKTLEEEDPATEAKPRSRVYMVYGGASRNFVECYSVRGADQLAARIDEMEWGSEDREEAERELISRAVMVEIEPDGRFVLPQRVREKIGFGADLLDTGGSAVLAGFTNRFKLYRREVYDAEQAEREKKKSVDPLALVGRHKRAV